MEKIGLMAVIDLSDFQRGVGQYNQSIGDMNKATADFASTAGGQFIGLGQNILSIGAAAAEAAVTGVAMLTEALINLAVIGVEKATSLEQSMANIAALGGKAVAEVVPLKELIMKLAVDPTLAVTATEAAGAIEILAKHGISASEILDGMGLATVRLANATGNDFNRASMAAIDTMQIFGKTGSEMTSVIDGIVGVTTHSKFKINDYQLALANGASVASQYGVRLEDFTTVLAGTASTFYTGQTAGTAFKTMLQRLANPTDEMSQLMAEYGISLFDSEGKMNDMAVVVEQLHNLFGGLATSTKVVGGVTQEMTAAAAAAAEKIPSLTEAIRIQENELNLAQGELGLMIGYYGAGSVQVQKKQIAIDKLNLSLNKNRQALAEAQGAIVAVNNAHEEVITTTRELTEAERARITAILGGARGSQMMLALSRMTKEEFIALRDEVNRVGQAEESAATRMATFQGAMHILQSVIEALLINIGDKFLPMLQDLALGFAELASKYGPLLIDFYGEVAGTLDEVIKGVEKFAEAFARGFSFGQVEGADVFTSVIGGIESGLIRLGVRKESVFKLINAIEELVKLIMGEFMEGIDSVVAKMPTFDQAFAFLTDTVIPSITTGIQFVIDHFEEFKGAIIGIGSVLAAAALAATIAGIASAIASLVTPVGVIIALAGLLGAAWMGNWFGIRDAITQAWSVIEPIISFIIDSAKSIFQAFQTGGIDAAFQQLGTAVDTAWPIIQSALAFLASHFMDWLKDIYPTIGPAVNSVINSISKWLDKNWPTIYAALSDWGNKFWDWVNEVAVPAAQGALMGIGYALLAWATSGEAQTALMNLGRELATALFDLLGSSFSNETQAAGVMAKLALGLIAGVGMMLGALTVIGGAIVGGIFAAIIEKVKPYVIQVTEAITSSPAWQALMGIVTTVSGIFTDVLLPAFNQVAGFLTSVFWAAVTRAIEAWNWLVAAATAVYNYYTENIQPVFDAVRDVIEAVLNKALEACAGIWQNILLPALVGVWDYISGNLQPILNTIADIVKNVVGGAVLVLSDLWTNTLLPAITSIYDYLSTTLQPVFNTIADVLENVFGGAVTETGGIITAFKDNILSGLLTALDGIKSILQDVTGFFNDMAGAINDFQLPPALNPGSPTPFELGLSGIASVASTILPAAMTTLQAVFIAFNEIVSAILNQIILLFSNINTLIFITIPTSLQFLAAIASNVFSQIIQKLNEIYNSLMQIVAAIQQIISALMSLGVIAQAVLSQISSFVSTAVNDFTTLANKVGEVNSALEEMSDILDDITETFWEMAQAAQAAAERIEAATHTGAGLREGLGFARGLGFQAGLGANTGGMLNLGYQIPTGYPGDTFGPLYAQSGEQMLITPRGTSIESLILSRLADLLGSIQGGAVQGSKVVQVNFNAPVTISNGMDWDDFQTGVGRAVSNAM